MATVAIVGGSEETRLLLRGLLRLFHHRVVGEGATVTAMRDRRSEPTLASVALVDFDLDAPETPRELDEMRRTYPGVRIVLLTTSRAAADEAKARALGIDGILRRPFAVHELMEVLEPVAAEPPSPR